MDIDQILPLELWWIILDRPELAGLSGILRIVCKPWRDYLRDRTQTSKFEIIKMPRLLNYSVCELGYGRDWVSPLIARHGTLEMLQRCPYPLRDMTLIEAAEHGDLNMVRWLICKGCRITDATYAAAASSGSIGRLEFLHNQGQCELSPCTCIAAARAGHIHVLYWARRNRCRWNGYVIAAAAGNGHLNIVIWAHENGCPWNARVCPNAARGNHFGILKWCVQNGAPLDVRTTSIAAAASGNLEMLLWVTQDPPDVALEAAARYGHLHILEFFNRLPTMRTTLNVILGGHLDILEWCFLRGFVLEERHCDAAAAHNQLEILKWLREKKVPWSASTLRQAIEMGYFELFRWAVENGCPKSRYAIRDAISAGHLDIIKWAIENDFPRQDGIVRFTRLPALTNWLRAQGFT